MKKLAFLILTPLLLLSANSSLWAQSSNTIGLSISPAIVEIAGDPGSQHKAQVVVTNTSYKPLPVSVEVTSLIPIDNEIDRSRRAEFDASSWIKINQNNLLLEPSETTTIDAEINVPNEANAGGHYAQVGFRVLSLENFSQKANAQIIPEVSASFFITVSGDINEKAEFSTDNMIQNYISKGSGAQIKFMLRNTGNVHILPAPKVTIFNNSGDISSFNLQPQLVLPNTEKEFILEWPADIGYGQYSARVETVYGSQNIPLVSDVSDFKVGPAWWQIALVLIVVFPALFIIFRRRHLPNFFKVLAGKRINLVGKRRYSRVSSSDKKEKIPQTVGEYDSIANFLGETKADKIIAVPQYPQAKSPSAVPMIEKQTPERTVIQEALEKTADEPISEIPASQKATITEFANPDKKDSKTVIVQTSASTIIRQEPKQEAAPKTELPPTIVRTEKPSKPVIKISISDGEPKASKPKTSVSSELPTSTRAEKVAKKAQAAQKKAKKKKL